MPKLKVLFFSHSANRGGAQNCLLSLLESLDREQIQPIVLIPKRGNLERILRARGLDYHILKYRWWLSTSDSRMAIEKHGFLADLETRTRKLATFIEKNSIDLVFSNSLVSIDGAFAAALSGRPHVWHALEMLDTDKGLFPLLEPTELLPKILAFSHTTACVSKSVLSSVSKFAPNARLKVIHTGVPAHSSDEKSNIRLEFNIPASSLLVLFTGILSERKGVEDLCSAAVELCKQRKDVVFLLAGPDGGRKKIVLDTIAANQLTERIYLLGARNDIPQLLNSADVFVLPSHADPLPVSVLEAMHAGKAIIATRSGGCVEMLVDGESGILVAPRNVGELSRAISTLLDSKDDRERMGNAARIRAQNMFSLTRYGGAFMSVFTSAMSETVDPRAKKESLLYIKALGSGRDYRFGNAIGSAFLDSLNLLRGFRDSYKG